MKNVIFIHAGNLIHDKHGHPNFDRCQNILNEIAKYILDSKIYEDVDSINVELVGDRDITFNVPKATINYNGIDVQQWEFPTLHKIINHARQNPTDNILYLHTKGSSNCIHVPEINWIEDVRRYHLYQNVTRYKEALEFLKTYDTCGAEFITDPVNHYSQNFWWARASHINTLILPQDRPVIFDERHKCEFWICSNSNSRYKSIYNIYNHYIDATDFSEHLYINKL